MKLALKVVMQNDGDFGKVILLYEEGNLSQYHHIHRKSHVNGPGFKAETPRYEASDSRN